MTEQALFSTTTEADRREPVGLKPGRLLAGMQVSEGLKNPVFFATEVQEALEEEANNVAVVKKGKLLEAMYGGTTVARVGEEEEFLGFVQLEEDDHDPTRIVAGTWVSNRLPGYENGSGSKVMKRAAELVFDKASPFPNGREVIARVRADNWGPQERLFEMGAELETTEPIISPKTKRPVNVWNLTMVGLRRV